MQEVNAQPQVVVQRAEKNLIESFHTCLDEVAREKMYIEMIEAPPLESVMSFQSRLIDRGLPVVYAVSANQVVGWCDISISENPRLRHRGCLGMGIRRDFRGQGIGSKLMARALEMAKNYGIEKVELTVYTTNLPAVALYEKQGFEHEGLLLNYRKLEGQYFNCYAMAKFL